MTTEKPNQLPQMKRDEVLARAQRIYDLRGEPRTARTPACLRMRPRCSRSRCSTGYRSLRGNEMKDGLYRVVFNGPRPFTAGFVVKRGCIVRAAPILMRKLMYWRQVARRISA